MSRTQKLLNRADKLLPKHCPVSHYIFPLSAASNFANSCLIPFLHKKSAHTKKATRLLESLCVGTALSSQAVTRQVFSTLMSLTSVFGMGTGGSSSPLAPTIYFRVLYPQNRTMKTSFVKDHPTLGQALDRLVLPSSMPHDTYTCSLSTL